MNSLSQIQRCLILLLLLLVQGSVLAASEVGKVTYARGVLTGQIAGQPPEILGKDWPLFNGQTLNTGSTGFAVIELDDGSRMTLRPKTTFKIENVETREGSENALFRLFRGGFRAITGIISKKKPDAFRVTTSVATLGIRGTEFDARLCEGNECDEENRELAKTAQSEAQVIGRVALVKGNAIALEPDDERRTLRAGSEVYELDELRTGINSYAVIAFNDRSRVTLSPSSAFKIEAHKYAPEAPSENNALLRFIRGGLRLVTGAIGTLNRKAYKVATPTATLGIRGTGFDIACDGDCVDNTALYDPASDTPAARLLNYFLKPAFAQTRNGMYTRVWEGSIEIQFEGGTMLLEQDRVAFIRNNFSPPVIVDDFPVNLRNMGNAPRPDTLKIDEDLVTKLDADTIQPGLYVNVRDGEVGVEGLDGRTVTLRKGQAGLAALDGRTIRLDFVPPFQLFDRIPDPSQLTPRMRQMIELFGTQGSDKQEFECRVQ